MTSDNVQIFIAGAVFGSMIGAFFGFQYGIKKSSGAWTKPEMRMLFAVVILVIWATSQMFSLAFGTQVDSWLNAIMGTVAGFFFGDGVIESIKSKS